MFRISNHMGLWDAPSCRRQSTIQFATWACLLVSAIPIGMCTRTFLVAVFELLCHGQYWAASQSHWSNKPNCFTKSNIPWNLVSADLVRMAKWLIDEMLNKSATVIPLFACKSNQCLFLLPVYRPTTFYLAALFPLLLLTIMMTSLSDNFDLVAVGHLLMWMGSFWFPF